MISGYTTGYLGGEYWGKMVAIKLNVSDGDVIWTKQARQLAQPLYKFVDASRAPRYGFLFLFYG